MNFELTKEHELLRKMIREFAEKEITPIAAEIDETEEFPLEVVKKMAKLGIMGLPIPRIRRCRGRLCGLLNSNRRTFESIYRNRNDRGRAHITLHLANFGFRYRRTKRKICCSIGKR